MKAKIKHINRQLADLDYVGHPEYQTVFANAVAYAEYGATKKQLTSYIEQQVANGPL